MGYKHSNDFVVNLAQAKEFSLKRQESLAQANSSRMGEIANKEYWSIHEFSLTLNPRTTFVQAITQNKERDEFLLFSLRRELIA